MDCFVVCSDWFVLLQRPELGGIRNGRSLDAKQFENVVALVELGVGKYNGYSLTFV
jgi:hypothetical protein